MSDRPADLGADDQDVDAVIRSILGASRRVAVVGASDDPERESNAVFGRLQGLGYDVVPVHPKAIRVHGVEVRPRLDEVAGPIDIVDVFRASEHAPDVAREAAAVGARALWLQLGIRSDEARAIARDAGMLFVEDRCLGVEASAAARERPIPPPT